MKIKTLKQSKLSQKVLCSVLAASVLGFSGLAMAANSDDLVAKGQTKSYSSSDAGDGSKKVIGGWNYKDNADKIEATHGNTDITVTDGKFDEVIGGSHIRVSKVEGNTLTMGNTKVTISGGEFGYITGGTKVSNASGTITTGNTNVVISGGTFNQLVMGGNYIKATGNTGAGVAAETTANANNTSVTISGGTFNDSVYGGSVADNYGSQQTDGKPKLTVNDETTNLTISGGTFNKTIFGAGMANGENSVVNVGTANLTLKGDDDLTLSINESGSKGNVFGGGYAANGGTVNVDNTNVNIENLSVDYGLNLHAGSKDAGVSNKTSITISNSELGKANNENKWQIIGGSRITSDNSKETINDAKEISILINDSHISADVRGGAAVFDENVSVTNGNSVVELNNTTLDGFSDQNNNSWTGRVFGAGFIQGGENTNLAHESAKVIINNVGGKTYDKDTGESVVNKEPGAEIYGGGQLYGSKKSVLNVKNTQVTVDGEDTAVNAVFGGNVISGTIKKDEVSTAVVGNTEVTVNNGNIVGLLVGGNNTNWFGTSVVGVLDEDGTYEYNGKKYSAGSTKVTLNGGGNADTLMVIGGSNTSYGYYYNESGKREAIVFGTTEVNINGGAAADVVGGGNAEYYYDGTISEDVGVNDDAPVSNVEGITTVNITDGLISNNVIGGGLAVSNQKLLTSTANVKGNTNINIIGGEIGNDVIAGGYAQGEEVKANVEGTATVNITDGTIKGDIIAGGYADGKGAEATVTKTVVNLDGGTVEGDIIATSDADINLNTVYNGDFIAQSNGVLNLFGDISLTESNQFTVSGGIINLAGGNMDGVLNIANGSSVNLNGATFTADDIANDITGGGKVVLKDKGVLSTTAGQVFNNGDAAGNDAGGVNNTAQSKIDFVSGTLNLTNEEYTLDYVKDAKSDLNSLTYNSENGTTSIVMSGTLISDLGENTISVDDAASVGDGIALDKVTVEAGKNLLVGVADVADNTTVDSIEVGDSVNNGFNSGSLNLAEDSTGVIITDGENVTLGGSSGDELITVNGDTPSAEGGVKVIVGLDDSTTVDGVTDKTGSFTIGNALANENTEYNLTGSVTVNDNSVLNVNGQTTVKYGVTLNNAAVNVGNGTLVSDVAAKGNVHITGNADIGDLTVEEANGASTVINIGSAHATASTSISNASLNGATICFDPDWNQAAGTHGIVFENSSIDGSFLVARNNYVAIGTDDNNAAKEMFAKTGLAFGEKDITAALYITGNQTLENGTGAIAVDGRKAGQADFGAVTAGSFTAADNSVVMVDGQSIKDTAAVSGVTDVTISSGSILYVDGAEKGETYKVLAGSGIDQGWADDNIISDNSLIIFNGDHTGYDNFDVTASYDKVNNVYGEGTVVIDSIVDKTLADKNAGDAAFDFFNDAVSSKHNVTKDAQAAALNSAANMGELAGVNHGTYSMSNAMTDAVAHHLSLATHGEQDKDIWAHYIHNKEDVDGMDFGGVDSSYEAQYNGIVVGSDLYKNGKTTAGIALSYADGNINGSNIASTTKNDAEYYGASLYGRIDNGDSAILGDISYMHSDNDITQNNSGHEITASADADAFSIGIRAEQAYKAGAGKFVPYAGIRYMHLGAGDYSNSLGMEYNADDQNLWLLPVGVTYSAEVQSGDWTVKPIAEVGYVWTMGDRDTDQTVSLNGASDTFGFETADSGSFIGRLGIEAEKADVTYGLSYEYQKGDTVKANKWMANLTFSF